MDSHFRVWILREAYGARPDSTSDKERQCLCRRNVVH
jgi:hypothetical protein